MPRTAVDIFWVTLSTFQGKPRGAALFAENCLRELEVLSECDHHTFAIKGLRVEIFVFGEQL